MQNFPVLSLTGINDYSGTFPSSSRMTAWVGIGLAGS